MLSLTFPGREARGQIVMPQPQAAISRPLVKLALKICRTAGRRFAIGGAAYTLAIDAASTRRRRLTPQF